MTHIQFNNISKRYGQTEAVSDFNLSVNKGELVALLGPSGCGKTTTLRMLAGFTSVTNGTITLGDKNITDMPSYLRNIGMVFQGYALFPHMTVEQNVAFGLEMKGLRKNDLWQNVHTALARVRLEGFADRLPKQLSGGQQQRVALARAMAINPDVLLLDEPLSALDARLRHDVRAEIKQLQRELGLTALMVTHDQDEALSMADRLVVMSEGKIEQVGTPAELYEKPKNRFVAEFMGRINLLEGGPINQTTFKTTSGNILRTAQNDIIDASCISFRPERAHIVSINTPCSDKYNSLTATIELFNYLGPIVECELRLTNGQRLLIMMPNNSDNRSVDFKEGAEVKVRWLPEDTRLLI